MKSTDAGSAPGVAALQYNDEVNCFPNQMELARHIGALRESVQAEERAGR